MPTRINTRLTETPAWALYEKSTETLLERRVVLPNRAQVIPPDLDPDLAWLEEWEGDKPAFDAATHHLTSSDVVDEGAGTVTKTYTAEAHNSVQLRAVSRTAMRTQWDGLPAYIRGPYRPLFDAANELLDEGDFDAAVAMVDAAEANGIISADPTKEATFNAVKAQFAAGVTALENL